MDKNNNQSFENIINTNGFDDRLSRSLGMFDTETEAFYQDFDELIDQIGEQGESDKRVTLNEKGYALELAINELLHQNYSFNEKSAEIRGIIRADISDLNRYICRKFNLDYTDEKKQIVKDLDEFLEDCLYNLNRAGVDIARSFSVLYMGIIKKILDDAISQMAERHYRDNQ